jgi:hypothetical protein
MEHGEIQLAASNWQGAAKGNVGMLDTNNLPGELFSL